MVKDILTSARRMPFTLVTLAALITVGVFTGSHLGATSMALIHRFGLAPHDVSDLLWGRVVTSVFITGGAGDFWLAVFAIAAFTGSVERRFGTPAAAATFWGAHVWSVLFTFALTLPLHLGGLNTGSLVYLTRDIGPSAGYVGCLGLLTTALHRRLKTIAALGVMTWLAAMLVVAWTARPLDAQEISAALAHLAAFPAGLIAGRLLRHRRPEPRVANPQPTPGA